MDAVIALGIAKNLWTTGLKGPISQNEMQTAVVHAEDVAVLEDGEVATGVAFPRLVSHQHDLAWNGLV